MGNVDEGAAIELDVVIVAFLVVCAEISGPVVLSWTCVSGVDVCTVNPDSLE